MNKKMRTVPYRNCKRRQSRSILDQNVLDQNVFNRTEALVILIIIIATLYFIMKITARTETLEWKRISSNRLHEMAN